MLFFTFGAATAQHLELHGVEGHEAQGEARHEACKQHQCHRNAAIDQVQHGVARAGVLFANHGVVVGEECSIVMAVVALLVRV